MRLNRRLRRSWHQWRSAIQRGRMARFDLSGGITMGERLYVIYDRVAEECGPVYQAHNDGVSLRQYRGLLQQVTRQDDYQLLLVGTIDTKTMLITPVSPPSEVVVADTGVNLFPPALDDGDIN